MLSPTFWTIVVELPTKTFVTELKPYNPGTKINQNKPIFQKKKNQNKPNSERLNKTQLNWKFIEGKQKFNKKNEQKTKNWDFLPVRIDGNPSKNIKTTERIILGFSCVN